MIKKTNSLKRRTFPRNQVLKMEFIQLNEYETDLYFPQNLQSNTTSCEPEIVVTVLQIKQKQFHVCKPYNIIKQTVVLLWKF